ncbi:MAG: hypothetical protein WCO55_02470 [Candidatus Falkowbacteria bacterium]
MANSYEADNATQPDLYYNAQAAQADELRRSKQEERIKAASTEAAALPNFARAYDQKPVAETDEDSSESSPDDYRQVVQSARRAKGKKEGGIKKTLDKVFAPAQSQLSELLVECWVGIPETWGLTLIWINIHAVMSLILSSVFCKLGHEWTGEIPGLGQAMGFSKKFKKHAEKSMFIAGMIEWGVLLICDAIIFAAVMIIIILLVFLVEILTDPIGTGWDAITNALTP